MLFICIYYLVRFWVNMNRLPTKIRKWRAKHALLAGRIYLNSAGINYFEGKYASAYKNAMKSTSKEVNKDNKFLAVMLAFKSMGYMQNYAKEDELFQELDSYKEKKWQLAKLMAFAENQYTRQKYGSCLDNLQQVLNLDKRHVPAHRIMLKVYLHLNNYEKAFEVLNWLIKYGYLEKIYVESYKLQVLRGLFENINDAEELYRFYRKLDNQDRGNGLINKFYFDGLIRLKEYKTVIDSIEVMQKSEPSFTMHENMLILAKKLKNKQEAARLLVISEKYLIDNKQDSRLLLVLGILSFTLELWDSARGYIEASVRLNPTLDGYLYLFFIAKSVGNQQLLGHAERMLVENTYNLV